MSFFFYWYNANMYNSLEFNSGRNALAYMVKKLGIEEIHIPYYLCDVIRHMLVKENCKPIFYHIDDNFYPMKDFSPEDYILYPNYFGICSKNIEQLLLKYPKLIVDNAHSYYDYPKGCICFNAGHKFGFKKSILWFKDEACENFILPKKENYQKYSDGFRKLHEKYKKENLIKIENVNNVCSFVYPLLTKTVQEADSMVKQLEKEGKTIYRFWNSLPESFNEYKFYSRLIPIPVL